MLHGECQSSDARGKLFILLLWSYDSKIVISHACLKYSSYYFKETYGGNVIFWNKLIVKLILLYSLFLGN